MAAPRVGLGVIVRRGGHVLLGQRHGSLGEGDWALPGGHLEMGESFEACAARETLEETGIALLPGSLRFVAAENVIFAGGQHYVVIFIEGDAQPDAEPQLLEPEKCRGWRWAEWDALPSPLFQPLRQLVARGFRPQPQPAPAASGAAG